jgi:hypothetical protein
MSATAQQALDSGDLNTLPTVAKKIGLGSILLAGLGVRLIRESVAVSSDAAEPSYTVKKLLSCKVSGGSTGNGEKAPQINGAVGSRVVRETGLVVATNAAPTTYPVDQLLSISSVVSSTRTRRVPVNNTATLSTGQAKGVDSSAIGTKSIALYASDVADGGTVDATYLTQGGCATPNSAGDSISFYASEVTGASAVAELCYLTEDPALDANGQAFAALDDEIEGIY